MLVNEERVERSLMILHGTINYTRMFSEETSVSTVQRVANYVGGLAFKEQCRLVELETKIEDIKGTKYALGMNPENLSESLKDKPSLVQESFPRTLQGLPNEGGDQDHPPHEGPHGRRNRPRQVDRRGKECGSGHFMELAEKIKRHRGEHPQCGGAPGTSATSSPCSTSGAWISRFPYNPLVEKIKELRAIQNERRRQREEQKRMEGMDRPNA